MFLRTTCVKLKSGCRVPPHWIWVRAWSSMDVRSKFVNFFEGQGHLRIPSSSVIPKKGEGTYFTNAGMNQFKPLFLGQCDPSSKLWDLKRAVNSQKCIRVGGKHNDLEDVGNDLTHHTFFEMLGSWSFGDYFKRESCRMAYDLLTNHFSIPVDRLYFTYFGGDRTSGLSADDECYDIWASLGIPKERILPFGNSDNFWDMGVTGPCGPCTEIHYDHIAGRYAGSEVNAGSPDVVEIWNLVFMQYNRHIDQSLTPLPCHHVDTGMGLERMVAVLNGTADNYNTDLFLPLFDVVHKTAQCQQYSGQLTSMDTAYRMLADHSRMLTVAISDGLLPSNDNLGHKVRTILHKCIQLCRKQFQSDPHVLLPALTKGIVNSLGETYPELVQNQGKVIDVMNSAIQHYDKTMEQAANNFHKMMTKVAPSNNALSGAVILSLEKGHYGSAMAVETITEMAGSRGLRLDMDDYHRCLDASLNAPSSHSPPIPNNATPPSPIHKLVDELIAQGIPKTDDSFKYDFFKPDGDFDLYFMSAKTAPCSIHAMQGSKGQAISKLEEEEVGEIILDRTCFYAEAGGQGADNGFLYSPTGIFVVGDVQKHRGYVVHSGIVLQGSISTGQTITPQIASAYRVGHMRNHTATHILNGALLEALPSTQQEGSNIESHQFTFDFLALSKFDVNEARTVESKVRKVVRGGYRVTYQEMSLGDALANAGVRRMQNEDYPEEVRLVTIGNSSGDHSPVSMELCGGTHVLSTSYLEDFCITGLSSQSQHVRRVTCVTGPYAQQARLNGQIVEAMCQLLQTLHAFINNQTTVISVDIESKILAILVKQQKLYLEAEEVDDFHDGDNAVKQNEKALSIMRSLCDGLETLKTQHPSQCGIMVMKLLVDCLHQSQHLDLLPKTERHTTHVCLQDMEHKVQTLVNGAAIGMLMRDLVHASRGTDNTKPQFISVDTKMNPRTVVKVISQNPQQTPIILVQEARPSWNIILSVPSGSAKAKSKSDMIELVKALQGFGSASGKVAKDDERQTLWRMSVKGKNLKRDVLDKSILQWWEGLD